MLPPAMALIEPMRRATDPAPAGSALPCGGRSGAAEPVTTNATAKAAAITFFIASLLIYIACRGGSDDLQNFTGSAGHV
jgi:hypothetical protein